MQSTLGNESPLVPPTKGPQHASALGVWIGIGAGIGALLDVVFHSPSLLAVGIAAGSGMGVLIDQRNNNHNNRKQR